MAYHAGNYSNAQARRGNAAQGTGRDTWEVQSEASATQHTQQAQATFANNGNFFKPVANPPAFPSFPPPPQQPQQQNPYSHPVTPNLPASHPSQQASWDERRNKLLNDGQNIWSSRAPMPPNLYPYPQPEQPGPGAFAAMSKRGADMSAKRQAYEMPAEDDPTEPPLYCGIFTPLKLVVTAVLTTLVLSLVVAHVKHPDAMKGLKAAFKPRSSPPSPDAPPSPPSPPSPPNEPPAVQSAEGMFNDPDVAAFVDAGASVSAKTKGGLDAEPNPLDTMLQGQDLTKPKLSVEIPVEVLALQAQRKELAQRKYALMADPPPMSANQASNKKIRAQQAKQQKMKHSQANKISKQEVKLVEHQSKILQQAQTSALKQWEMALKADPLSYSLTADEAAPPAVQPQALNATEQRPSDSMASSGA